MAHGLSSCGLQALEHGLVVVAHWLSCSAACGIFQDQGLNLCPLNWQVDSYPLYHQGSPIEYLLKSCFKFFLKNLKSGKSEACISLG